MCEINFYIRSKSGYWATYKWDDQYTKCLKFVDEDIMSISLARFLLAKYNYEDVDYLKTLNFMINWFVSF